MDQFFKDNFFIKAVASVTVPDIVGGVSHHPGEMTPVILP